MRKVILIIASLLVLILIAGGFFLWNAVQEFMTIETIQYDPQLTLFIGGGGNSIVLTSEDGAQALIVDTKMSSGAEKLRESVKANDIIIVNTHNHADHTGGNALFPSAKVIAGAYTQEQWPSDCKYPDIALKHGEEQIIQIGSEKVHIANVGQAHSTNDVVVYLEGRKALVTGDVVLVKTHPPFVDPNANVKSWIKILENMEKKYDAKVLVPGHGKVSDKDAISEMKTYFVSIMDAIGDQGKLQTLKTKYSDYDSIPLIMSFDNTVAFIQKEGQ